MNIIIGFLSGAAASMGFGGGFVLIIYLTAFAGVEQITAQGVNLLFFLPVAFLSLIFHAKNKLIQWKILPSLIFTGLIGVLAGTFVSRAMSVALLQKLFASMLVFVGIKEIFHKNPKKSLDKQKNICYNDDTKCNDREKSS